MGDILDSSKATSRSAKCGASIGPECDPMLLLILFGETRRFTLPIDNVEYVMRSIQQMQTPSKLRSSTSS